MKRFFNSIFSGDEVLIQEISPTFFPYGGGNIPLKYKPNSRAKRLTLRISTKDKSLVLIIPPKTNSSDIQAFLRRCIPWVEKNFSKNAHTLSVAPGVDVNLNGVAYTCVTDPLRRKPALCKISQTLRLPKTYTQKGLFTFFKEVAAETLTPLIEKVASALGQRIERVSIRDTKSRWGSCSARKTISLNWRLILAPTEVAYYVCVHEAAHLLHMNHSKDFWKVVEEHCPNYKVYRKWLKMNGGSLLSM